MQNLRRIADVTWTRLYGPSARAIRVHRAAATGRGGLVDDKNEIAGFDADIARELAKRMGVAEVDFVQSNFQNFIPGTQNDKFDVVVSGQTVTKEGAKQVSFSTPYEVNGVAIFVKGTENSIRSSS